MRNDVKRSLAFLDEKGTTWTFLCESHFSADWWWVQNSRGDQHKADVNGLLPRDPDWVRVVVQDIGHTDQEVLAAGQRLIEEARRER